MLLANGVPTYQEHGFLAWDPEAEQIQPGLHTDNEALKADIETMVAGVGQEGCGFEAQLESLYRFLVDPNPHASIKKSSETGSLATTTPSGVDTALLEQRADFLRPDSLVAVVMLSDENDCSFDATGYGYLTGGKWLLDTKATSECAENPGDACCRSCESGGKTELCGTDANCSADVPVPQTNRLSNLTCMQQKRRYGVDFLYPVQRYIDGFTQTKVANESGEIVDNPLFVSANGIQRSRDRVAVLGIVGVPWQLIARKDDTGTADLSLGLQTAGEMEQQGTWDQILGDPNNHVQPASPYMKESIEPRAGIPGPDSTNAWADPIVGHDYIVDIELNNNSTGYGNLQHACIFELPEPIDCGTEKCDCERDENNPLCQEPDGTYSTTQQRRAKAYPGLRQLAVLKGIEDQGVVSSICPAQLSDQSPQAGNYGYRPAIAALIAKLKEQLADPCLTTELSQQDNGQVSCVVIEGRQTETGEACTCPGARSPLDPQSTKILEEQGFADVAQGQGLDCFCEIDQLSGESLALCREEVHEPIIDSNGDEVDGWCYVDTATPPVVANETLTSHCSANGTGRVLRFVGEGEVQSNATLFYHCTNES